MLRPELSNDELLFIRHAPAAAEGRLAGRRDVGLEPVSPQVVSHVQSVFAPLDLGVVCSPAIRCRETVRLIWPGYDPVVDARLWEQDFGEWEGMPFEDLPDLGEMTDEVLADHCPPQGESFNALCGRVQPAFAEAAAEIRGSEKPLAIIAHAGVIRGALAMLAGAPAALRFEVAPLSVTRFRCLPDGSFSAISVNGYLS